MSIKCVKITRDNRKYQCGDRTFMAVRTAPGGLSNGQFLNRLSRVRIKHTKGRPNVNNATISAGCN
jgi:hypothetical protein